MENLGSSSSQLLRPCSSSQEPPRTELLFVIYGRDWSYIIKAFDKKGTLLPKYCFTIPRDSLPSTMGFAGLGSDLYMIGGYNIASVDSPRRSLDVYVFNLNNISCLVDGSLSHDFIRPGPRLNGRKIEPLVFEVKGFIYVLSKYLVLKEPYPNFEVLDPSNGAWVVLPEPPLRFDASNISFGFYLEIESHALKDDRYIIISVSKKKGVYAFDLHTYKWSVIGRGPLPFHGKSVSLDGFYYAFCLSRANPYSILNVFPDVMCPPLEEIGVATSPNVFEGHLGEIVVMGNTVLNVRAGFATSPDSGEADGPDHHMTIDRFEVRMVSNDDEGSGTLSLKPKAVKRRSRLLKLEDTAAFCSSNLLYCVPMLLPCSNSGYLWHVEIDELC